MAEVKVEGLRELGLKLQQLPKEIAGKNGGPLLKALRRMGARIQKSAKSKVSVKTGTLRDNIIVVRKDKRKLKPGQEGVDVTVRFKARAYKDNARNRRAGKVGGTYKNFGPLFYAKFLEFGTSRMPARPFMRPAFEEAKGAMGDMFREDLSKSIDEAVRKLAKKKL